MNGCNNYTVRFWLRHNISRADVNRRRNLMAKHILILN